MMKNENLLAEGGIRFFGRMSASATHEIKNNLAIINESAGLLADLSLMAQKGPPLSHVRINDIVQRVTKQVQRADRVLKKINRFSHSADLVTEMADLEKTVIFVLELASRIVEQQGIAVEVIPPSSPMMTTSNYFYLENMIWRAIETSCCAVQGEKQVKISFGTDSALPSIWFSMHTVKDDVMADLFGSKEDRALIAYLALSIKKNKNNNGFGLLWPKHI
jgi:light-regulated signal transduction histidine kinase (bacteriophytochrome)